MTEKPILFSAAMVRAILAGNKTQTRRILKPQPNEGQSASVYQTANVDWQVRSKLGIVISNEKFPYTVGDIAWVREPWRTEISQDKEPPRHVCPGGHGIHYEADKQGDFTWGKLRPGMFMCRWMSRISLKVTAVKVERLQDISREDAIAEGLKLVSENIEQFFRWPDPLDKHLWLSPVEAYRFIWESINGKGSWQANPFVAAYSFERIAT